MRLQKKNQRLYILAGLVILSLFLGFRIATSLEGVNAESIFIRLEAIIDALSSIPKRPFFIKFTLEVAKTGFIIACFIFLPLAIFLAQKQILSWKWDAYFDLKRKKNKIKPKGLKVSSDKFSASSANEMIGLEDIKSEINQLINYSKVQRIRRRRGLSANSLNLHLVFYGNPGTGKTVMARYLARELKKNKILKTGQLIEADRSIMVAPGPGQTAPLVHEVVEAALGGILFIDEAYTLTASRDSYGLEAVNTLLKLMEDYKDDLVVIVAGYDDLMEDFVNSNPGLRSRFTKHFHFRDYNAVELVQIFDILCKKRDYTYSEDAATALLAYFQDIIDHKDENFANGRLVRNIFEEIIAKQAIRVGNGQNLSRAALMMIAEEDVTAVSLKHT
jgi:SpoVK/Ycf46/Vps4 family AAA+-type ATPase